jgi:outer membrane lipoprotein-sorting protein
MEELGDALELLHNSEPRWRTLRAAGRQWRHQARANEAFERHLAALRAGNPASSVVHLVAYVPDGTQPTLPDETEDHWRLWMEKGGRTRAEHVVGDETHIVVFDGPTWWSWSPRAGGMTNGGAENHQHGFGPAGALVDTSALLSALRLQLLDHDTLLGRRVFTLRGLPRARFAHQLDHGPQELGVGADDYVLKVDEERGVVLRAEARFREQPFMVIEMTDLEFDVDLPPETFTIHLPDGQAFEDVSKRRNAFRPRGRRLFLRKRRR